MPAYVVDNHPGFLYRFDSIESLYWQRFSDPVLRSARRTGNEEIFPHYQCREAQAVAPLGYAVFRICFWKTLDDAFAQRNLCEESWVLQRIKFNHPSLDHYSCGDDEYLQESAYIFWGTFKIDSERPEWSPIGIPHTDIEILTPEGQWVPMNDARIFREHDPGWELRSNMGSPVQVRHEVLPNGSSLMMMRQMSGPWRTFLNSWADLHWLVEDLANSPQVDLFQCRWLYALETHDKIRVIDLNPIFAPRWRRGVSGLIDRMRKAPEGWYPAQWQVRSVSDQQEVADLYAALGLDDMRVRRNAWHYTNPDMIQAVLEESRRQGN